MSGYIFYIQNFVELFTNKSFKGWGRKKTGNFAKFCYEKFGGELTLKEDGFIRSLDLGINDSSSFSRVEDNIGIYYDATVPSKLENILNSYNFSSDTKLMVDARKAIKIILESNISKYNSSSLEVPKEFLKDELRVLVIAQTQGDASLQYGMLDNYTTEDMIEAAIDENPNATVYLKVHPDVLSGKKYSDIKIEDIQNRCIVIK
ncbi:MAG: capsular polysaccharide biosynthesis protein, partial [Epsilonproteobacteria bacterium]